MGHQLLAAARFHRLEGEQQFIAAKVRCQQLGQLYTQRRLLALVQWRYLGPKEAKEGQRKGAQVRQGNCIGIGRRCRCACPACAPNWFRL